MLPILQGLAREAKAAGKKAAEPAEGGEGQQQQQPENAPLAENGAAPASEPVGTEPVLRVATPEDMKEWGF